MVWYWKDNNGPLFAAVPKSHRIWGGDTQHDVFTARCCSYSLVFRRKLSKHWYDISVKSHWYGYPIDVNHNCEITVNQGLFIWPKLLTLLIWEFHAGSKRRSRSLDVINRQRIIDFPLLCGRIYFLTGSFAFIWRIFTSPG